MMLFAEEYWGYYVQGQIKRLTEKTIVESAEEVLEELDFDCVVLDAFRPDDARDEWYLDFSGNWGVIRVDTEGAHSPAQIKDRIRSRLLSSAGDAPPPRI